MLAIDSSRTRAYLQAMDASGRAPCQAILIGHGTNPGGPGTQFPSVPYFDNIVPAADLLAQQGVPVVGLSTADVNAAQVVDAVGSSACEILIYSGPAGAILRPEILALQKRFLHVHPGALPGFRGSTPFYFSLIESGTVAATALFLSENIDEGPIIATWEYEPPRNRELIDYGFDPAMRADTLVRTLDLLEREPNLTPRSQASADGETYHVVHPVLKHIAILSGDVTVGAPDHELRLRDP